MKKNLNIFSDDRECPVRNVLDRFGDKWSVLVIMILGTHGETIRFNALKGVIGDISQKMLTTTLRTLEADGLVVRKYYPEIPPRVEYQISPLGKTLLPHIDALASWANKNRDTILKTRRKYTARTVAA